MIRRLPALPLALVLAASPAVAESTVTDDAAAPLVEEAPWPVPRGALAAPDDDGLLPTIGMEEPAFSAKPASTGPSERREPPVPVSVIRDGLGGSAGDRRVGLRLGRDVFSVESKLQAPENGGREARLDWRLGQPVGTEAGLIWGAGIGGGGAAGGTPEQLGDVTLGWRHRLVEHLALTSRVALAGRYGFAREDGLHSNLTPEVALSADIAAMTKLPFPLTVDLAVTRQVPVFASAFETRGSAHFALRYALD